MHRLDTCTLPIKDGFASREAEHKWFIVDQRINLPPWEYGLDIRLFQGVDLAGPMPLTAPEAIARINSGVYHQNIGQPVNHQSRFTLPRDPHWGNLDQLRSEYPLGDMVARSILVSRQLQAQQAQYHQQGYQNGTHQAGYQMRPPAFSYQQNAYPQNNIGYPPLPASAFAYQTGPLPPSPFVHSHQVAPHFPAQQAQLAPGTNSDVIDEIVRQVVATLPNKGRRSREEEEDDDDEMAPAGHRGKRQQTNTKEEVGGPGGGGYGNICPNEWLNENFGAYKPPEVVVAFPPPRVECSFFLLRELIENFPLRGLIDNFAPRRLINTLVLAFLFMCNTNIM